MDDLEADYFGELLPFEEWEQYDKRQTRHITNDLIGMLDMVQDYYFEQEELN